MSGPSVHAVDAVRRFLRSGIRAAAGESGPMGRVDSADGPRPGRDVAVRVETSGPVTVLLGPQWTAWVLVVLPEGSDPVLVEAARMRAESLAPAGPPPNLFDMVILDDDSSQPEPEPTWATAVMDVGLGRRALVLLAAPAAHGELLDWTTEECRDAARKIRRNLPGSASWAVASLPAPAGMVYERAARIASRAKAAHVDVGHLAAALLTEADLESTAQLEGPLLDPAPGVLELLKVPEGRGLSEAALRGRVAQTLATVAPSPRQTTGDEQSTQDPFLDAVRSGSVPGVTLIAPTQPGPAAASAVLAAADPITDTATSGEEPGSERHAAAAFDVVVQLGRTDTTSVWLTGAPADRIEVLARLAALCASGSVSWLAGRHVLVIDASQMPPAAEAKLVDEVSYWSVQLVLAMEQSGTRLGERLAQIALGGNLPTIRMSHPWPAAPLGSAPIVRVGTREAGQPTVADMLAPIAEQLAGEHRVTLAPGVVEAAAAAVPGPATHRKDSLEALLDDEGQEDTSIDPIVLGRARLDYACSRAALRPDREVTPADVPLDPNRALPVRRGRLLHPSTQFVDLLGAQIIDQPQAVRPISERLTFAARGLGRTGPRATMLFAGPPGTGKTHTAGVIAATYFGDPEAVIRIDCGAMYDRHTINTLLGAPPAYVGYDDNQRLLTTQINNHHGRCVVLFDEIEKADRGVLDILLGVLDCGLLTDLQQRTADASQAIFILTSNLGSELFTRHAAGFTATGGDQTSAAIHAEIRAHLRPELVDRIDDIVIYRPLTHAGITELTSRHLTALTADLAAAGYHIDPEPALIEYLARHVETIGVRGLRRYIETTLLRDLLTRPPGRYQAHLDPRDVTWRSVESM